MKDSFSDAVDYREVTETSLFKISLTEIIEHVSVEFGIPSEDLLLPHRGRSFPERDVAIYIAHRHSRETLTSLATHFGMTRHGSAGSAVKRVVRALSKDRKQRTRVKELEKRLTPNLNTMSDR